MFSKKKTCGVCGFRFTPKKEEVYTAQETRSVAELIAKAPILFSATDCPRCGCQIALAIRAPRIDDSDAPESEESEAAK